jgi:hypothetical protein
VGPRAGLDTVVKRKIPSPCRDSVFQVEVFCVVTSCSVVVGYRRFVSQCCLHLQGEVTGVSHSHIITDSQSVSFGFEPIPGLMTGC